MNKINKIINNVNNLTEYQAWHFVKQNYNFNVVKTMICKIVLWQNSGCKESFEQYNIENCLDPTDSTLLNFRNARTLNDLNIIENPGIKIKYQDYIIPQVISKLAFENDDINLKKAITERMLSKNIIFRQKSNKPSPISTHDEIIHIEPFKVLTKVLIKLFEKSKSTEIFNTEISCFIATLNDEKDIDDIVDVIIEYRKNNLLLTNVMQENRFHLTLELLNGMNKISNGKGYKFDVKTLKKNYNFYNIENNFIEIDKNTNDKEIKKYFIDSSSGKVRNPILQKYFRDNLIIEFNNKCCLCGIKGDNIVTASHIKSVSQSFKENSFHEFPNPKNGLLLCYNHDALFDKYIISIDNNGKVVGNLHNLVTFENIAASEWLNNEERKKFLKIHYGNYLNKTKLILS